MSDSPAGERTSTRRKWAAIGVATALLAGAFWLVLLAFDMWLGDLTIEELEAGAEVPVTAAVAATLGGGALVMAAAFAALALISRRPRPWRSISFAFLLGSAMWLWLPFIAGEPYTPMVAGFAAGGVVALRAEPEHTIGRRVVAALLVTDLPLPAAAAGAAARGDRGPAAALAGPGLGRCHGRAAGRWIALRGRRLARALRRRTPLRAAPAGPGPGPSILRAPGRPRGAARLAGARVRGRKLTVVNTGTKQHVGKDLLTAGGEGWGFYSYILAGVLLGWGADHWLGTKPIFIVIGLRDRLGHGLLEAVALPPGERGMKREVEWALALRCLPPGDRPGAAAGPHLRPGARARGVVGGGGGRGPRGG